MSRLTVLGGKNLKNDYGVAIGRDTSGPAPPSWEYPHDVTVLAPCRRTFFVNCILFDKHDRPRCSTVRVVALDLPWHVVGPSLRSVSVNYAACLLLGFDADPRGAPQMIPRRFPLHSYAVLHHCLGAGVPEDISFWNTAFRLHLYEEDETKGTNELASLTWQTISGVFVRVDP